MTDRDSTSREEGLALATELRHIAEALVVADLEPEDVAAAHRLATALRERLTGPRRPRWYDAAGAHPESAPEARHAYLAQSPIRGHLNPVAPPLVLGPGTRGNGARCVVGELQMGRRYEGPPHGVHGGWVAALFDEALGAAQSLGDTPGMTAVLKVRYRQITPVKQPLRFEAWIHEQRGRRTVARATCHAGDRLTADAEGIFIGVDFDEVEERMSRAPGSSDDAAV
ncbi:MAG: PaaI family thioesterase [Deltaproteobacteria bacterium]|nr:PaaI family thioesterase [Deltaproteobacteria bacterium]